LNLRQFVLDLHSNKLHREFHNGPDPTEAPKPQQIDAASQTVEHIPKATDNNDKNNEQHRRSTPPESVFIKLAPGPDRYSIKHGDGGEL
jgi:endoplasmic reticulum resident protein 44